MRAKTPIESSRSSELVDSSTGGEADAAGSTPSAKKNVDSPGETGLTVAARAAIPLGYAVIVAVFVALGIQGDVFARLMRNDPAAVGLAFILAVIAVVIPLVALVTSGTSDERNSHLLRIRADIAGAALLVTATIIAVWSGVNSYSEREQPIIQLTSASSSAEGTATLTVVSSALSLQTWQRLLLRIEAFDEGTSAEDAHTACRDTKPLVPNVEYSHLVYWGEVGPTSTGSAAATVSTEVSTTDYQYVCAFAVLSDPKNHPTDGSRYSSMLVDVRQLPQDPATTQSQ